MLTNKIKNTKIILASQSPRRQEMLKDLGIEFEIRIKDVDETYPGHLKGEEVASYLAELKAKAYKEDIAANEIIITADTIVCIDDEILGKPKDETEACEMLGKLSGRSHRVITGVCLQSQTAHQSFTNTTKVYFKELSSDETNFYIKEYKPYDKAGGYGIQEWIGYIGIEKIEGSYFNVVGLPIQQLYCELEKFLDLCG